MGKGSLTIITGPMACGKSEELIRRLKRATIARQKVLVFKPEKDTRNEQNSIASRCGTTFSAITVKTPQEIIPQIDGIDAVGIEEAHFFPPQETIGVVRQLINQGKRVIVSGLDMDFLGEPFETVILLMGIADRVLKLSAICVKCQKDAVMSQKTVNGEPARRESKRFESGGDEKYFPVCRDCHIIPD